MPETRAIVIQQIAGGRALVEAVREDGCGFCAGSKSCGGGTLSQLFCLRPRHFQARNAVHAGVGDEVRVSVADGILWQSALILYGLPLLLLFGGAFAGAYWPGIGSDVASALGAGIGLVSGFGLAAYVVAHRKFAGAAEAVILDKNH